MANAFEGPGGRRSSASKLFPPKFGTPTGQEVDEEKLLHIFKEIDTDHSGSIDLDELGEAMRMLGIKCTYAFVRKALRSIDTDRNGTIEPHEFVKFFSTVTNPDEFRDLLGKQNQKYYDYKTMASEDPTFGRRFRIPQTISREHKISKHQESVESVKWLDRNRFISASLDRTVKIWDVSGPLEPLASFDYPSPIYSMTASPKGTWAVMGFGKAIDKEEQIYLSVLDIDNKNTEKAQMKGQDSPVFATAISPGEMYIASGSKSGRVLLHDVRTCKLLSELRRSPRIIQAIDFSEDARRVVSCGNDGDVALTDISAAPTTRPLSIIEEAAATDIVYDVAFRGEYEIITCGGDFCCKRWDLRQIKKGPVQRYLGHTSAIRTIVLSDKHDAKYFLSGAEDGCIRLWIIDEMEIIQDQIRHLEREHNRINKELDAIKEDLQSPVEMLKKKAQATKKQISSRLGVCQTKLNYMKDCEAERNALGCVQAHLSLAGTRGAVSSISWRERDSPSNFQVVSAGTDQSIYIHNIDLPKADKFEKWAPRSSLVRRFTDESL